MANIDNLNFKVILDDKDFEQRVKSDIALAKQLNTSLSNLLNAKVNMAKVSAQDAASAKRASDVLAKQAIDQERIKQAALKTAEAEERVRTQAAKTTNELEKAKKAAADAALAQQRVATEAQRTAAATNNAAVSAQRLRTETQRTATETQRTATEAERTATASARASMAQRKAANYAARATKQYQAQSRLLNELKGYVLGYLSIHGAKQLISSLVRVTGEFELQKTTLAAMLGDLSKAESIMASIKGLAVESPFTFGELSTYAKQLSAFSVPAKELFETTKMLADVSAGLGVGMDRIVLAYGQVRSAAFLRGQEVRQFTEAGIPILDELAKQFEELEGQAVSTGEVFDRITARLVPFEMVAKVLKDMTSEGGKFYNMQSIQSETLRGKVLKLKDAYQLMLNEIGESRSGGMKNALDGVVNLMKNWEKVGNILKTLIVTFGVYKATLGAVWAAERITGAVRMFKYYEVLTQRVSKATAAYMAFGKSLKVLKTMQAGIALGAIAGLVTILATAIKKAGELKRELKSIVSSELSGSNKMVDDLNALVARLKDAKQGSQNYREAISEINRKYGDYLPKVLSEADAYHKVAEAAKEAADAIQNKSRASAFEKGTEKIEEKYGKGLTELAKGVENALLFLDPSIPKKAAIEFVKRFKETITTEGEGEGFYETFGKVYKEFFGKDDLGTLIEAADGKIEGYSDRLESLVGSYGEMVNKIADEQRNLDEELDLRFGQSQYSSMKEMQGMLKIEEWYNRELNAKEDSLKNLVMTQDEYNKAVEKLDIQKLRKQIHLYDTLRRTDIANDLRKQLEDLTRVPEGWRGVVQKTLTEMGLNKTTSFGLWADDTTRSVSYVEDMVKRYKELSDEITMVKPFDTAQANRLKTELTAIETIAKQLGIDIKELAATGADTAESKEEKRLKRLIASLRTMQNQYEKLKALGASDASIKSLFEGLYPELIAENGKDFVTDLKYLERAVGLVEELEKIAPEDAKKILVDLGKDEFSIYLKKLKDQQKAYKDSATAAGKYFNMLRKWSTEEFNLNGEGITLDVSKIASGLSSKINEIELTATKAKELFGQIDVDSEEEVAKVKEIFVKEFGADAWDLFWNTYYSKGVEAIDDLAQKQKEYEKKLAQEKVNDLAQKYVKESYFEGNIELSDLGDKNYFQLRSLRKRLQELLNKEPLQISVELKNTLASRGIDTNNLVGVNLPELYEELQSLGTPIEGADQEMLNLIQSIQKAKLSTEDFSKVIKKVISGDIKNLTQEEGEALMSMVTSYMGELKSLFQSISEYAETIGGDELQGAMNGIVEAMDILGSVADRLAKGDWIGAIISGVTSLAKTILDASAAQAELNNRIRETVAEMKVLNSEKAINAGVESVFGTDDFKKFQNAYDEAVKAHEQANKDIEKQNQRFYGNSKDNWGVGGVAGSLGAGAALGAAVGSIFPVIGTAIGAGVGALVGMVVGLVGHAATEANDYSATLQEMADSIDGELINADTGAFDVETLKKIKETYTDLDSEYKEMLDELIANAEVYENAITQMASYMTEVFGQCADDMADSFIESFKESGQAALDYGDIVSDVATNIAKSLIKSTILQNVFDEKDARRAASKLASGDVAGAVGIVENAMESAKELTPYIQQLLESLQPYFEMGEETEGQSLGDGIKGITEDTANLLASYLNAIRSDTSQMRAIQALHLPLISQSMPTIMDHLARIQANTFDTATFTERALGELVNIYNKIDDVIASEGGTMVVRTTSY